MSIADPRQRIVQRRDRLKHLRVFCRVAELGCLAQAAVSLGLSRRTVSLKIGVLEKELETFLLDRNCSSTSLTPAGEILYEMADPLVRGMEALFHNTAKVIRDATCSQLALAATATGAALLLPRHIKWLRDRYPRMRVRVRTCQLREGIKRLSDGEVEMFLGADIPDMHDGLQFHEVFLYRLVVITSWDHPLAHREGIESQELASWPAITRPENLDIAEAGAIPVRALKMDLTTQIEVPELTAVKHYVEVGLGIAVVPDFSVQETDQLSTISINNVPSRGYGVYTRHGEDLSPPALDLLRHVNPNSSETPSAVPDNALETSANRIP